jgi:hypothetical protein
MKLSATPAYDSIDQDLFRQNPRSLSDMSISHNAYGTNSVWLDTQRACQLSNLIASALWQQLVREHGPRIATFRRSVLAEFQMRHTAPLLDLAATVAEQNADLSNAIYFRKHYAEEVSHHAWGLADLREAKKIVPPDQQGDMLPAAIRRLIDNQYNALEQKNVRAFLGYIVALEGFPGTRSYWVHFADDNGIPRGCFRSPMRHAVLDRAHSHELFEHIEERYECQRDRQYIAEIARSCIATVGQALAEPFDFSSGHAC